jgi:hypothetical protein
MVDYRYFDRQIRDAIRNMQHLDENMINEIQEESHKLAKQIQAKAKQNALSQGLKKTAELIKGIKVRRPTQKNKKKKILVSRVVTTARHGIAWELGYNKYIFGKKTNQKVQGRPYLRTAGDSIKEVVGNKIKEILNKYISRW